ncbi:ADP-ribose pyrophosphatase [Peribacillus deserti]|uniref:ADP-ribose pyrophosphatase n=2 Tax=Peribacillus deserti TaxID=673318 RepID=A0A2N5M227_9BACI|nr:ADP-ribose pyrophosphatase [Peribacillus deserti]
MMKNLEEKTIATTQIFSGRIVSLQVDKVELPDGKTSTREIVKHPGAVAIIAITPENKIVLVEQYRKPMERTLVEIPAGKLEKGEDPLITAVRELEEETGYECEKMEYLTGFYTSPGFADELIHVYLATGLNKKENAASLDEDEFVEILEVTREEMEQLMKEQKIYDAKTVYALQYLQLEAAAQSK